MLTVSNPPNLVTIPVVVAGITFTTVPVINDTAINITWTPPTNPNGSISSYIMEINSTSSVNMRRIVQTMPINMIYTRIINGLSKFPYVI